MPEITLGKWIVEFPEEMDRAEIDRIITKHVRLLEQEGIKVFKKKEEK